MCITTTLVNIGLYEGKKETPQIAHLRGLWRHLLDSNQRPCG